MDYLFVYDSNATYNEIRQYLANLGLKKFISKRRNPSEPIENDESPDVMKKLLKIMLLQARALGWEIPWDPNGNTWDPWISTNTLPPILHVWKTEDKKVLSAQELKALLQNQVKLLVNIVKEHKLYAFCERSEGADWAESPEIIIPLRIKEDINGDIFWGLPKLWVWVPPRGKRKGYRKYFVYDEASGKRVFIKSRKVGKKEEPACSVEDQEGQRIQVSSKVWHHPQMDLQNFITTEHHWPVPFFPQRWRENKPEAWLAELVGKEIDDPFLGPTAQPGAFSFEIPGRAPYRQMGGAYIEFADPDPLMGNPLVDGDAPLANEDVDDGMSLNPEILPRMLPDGSPPPEELALTDNGEPYQWQELAIEKWWNSSWGPEQEPWTGGLIEACTGAGKTKFCLKTIDRVLTEMENLGVDDRTRVSIIVPTKSLLAQWYGEILEAMEDPSWFNHKINGISRHGSGFSEPVAQISIWIINTAAKEFPVIYNQHPYLEEYTSHFLIVDEVHRSTSREFRKIYQDKADFKLGVTATLPGKGEKPNSPGVRKFKFLKSVIGDVVCQYKYPHALMKGTISKFKLTYIETEFTSGEKVAYDKLTEKIEKLGPRVASEAFKTMFPEGYDEHSYKKLTQDQKDFVGDPLLLRILKFLGASRARIDWCAARRMACAADLIRQKLEEGKKIIVFHKSIHGAMALYNLLTMGYGYGDLEAGYSQEKAYNEIQGPLNPEGMEIGLYHSGNPAHVNDNFLEAFRRGPGDTGHKVRCLLSVESLLEGLDVPSADVGISVAATKSEIKAIQSLGRVLRIKRNLDGTPIEEEKEFFFITIKESQGDAAVKLKFENSLRNSNGDFIIDDPIVDDWSHLEHLNYHTPSEIDHLHKRSGLFSYEQLYSLATELLKDHDLITRSQLVNAIMNEEDDRRRSREEAEEAGIPYDEELITGVEWYRPPQIGGLRPKKSKIGGREELDARGAKKKKKDSAKELGGYPDWALEKPEGRRKRNRLRRVRKNPYSAWEY